VKEYLFRGGGRNGRGQPVLRPHQIWRNAARAGVFGDQGADHVGECGAVGQHHSGHIGETLDLLGARLRHLRGDDAAARMGHDAHTAADGVDPAHDRRDIKIERDRGRIDVVSAVAGKIDGVRVQSGLAQIRQERVPRPTSLPGSVQEDDRHRSALAVGAAIYLRRGRDVDRVQGCWHRVSGFWFAGCTMTKFLNPRKRRLSRR
jgi:hypothetical protein